MSSLKRPFHDQAPGPKRSAWQLPASCDFCRLKKIRCDKKRPCSSCKDRDTEPDTRHSQEPTMIV
ncbi:Zn(II)2Cys6 transcription factor domain-containing protein [Aspergillus niger CBS 101883]|uniref:Zn(II)2Cys6 transcription factor domain-containing protein n=1 Tax=Aspergillus lacticoffeatus (strain CBS 101883) TaxID=1450533 RepID=UPI000D802374|nr:uncharacterized protein BO96DRAFT_194534 [Aspergillus niger CBS 101883]PYH51305.1 hypothetical protein BO96DRAFT_194534 [Aspergillus niger CBS 101883]